MADHRLGTVYICIIMIKTDLIKSVRVSQTSVLEEKERESEGRSGGKEGEKTQAAKSGDARLAVM